MRPAPARVLLGLFFASFACACGSEADERDSRDGSAPSAGPPSARSIDGPAPEGEAASAPAPAPLDVPEDAPLVVFLGDSISAGLHLPADQAFPAVVQRRLHEQGVPFRLVNAGVSGDTSAGGLARVDWVLRQEPDVLVVELGGNDGLRGLPLDSVEANLRGICERARAKGAQVLLLGVRIPPSYGPYAADFDAIYERIAADLDVPLVPFFMEGVGGVAEQNLEDAMHPTPEGHATIAENVAPALRELLADGT